MTRALIFLVSFFILGLYVDIPVCLKDSRRSQREKEEDPARCLLRIAAAEFRHLLGDGLCVLHRELDHLEETPALLLAASNISNASNVPVIR